jgi:phosphonoacetaldehyde hydrolase
MSVTGVIFDWDGTILDHGSLATVAAFQDTFAGAGISLEPADIRLSMGLAKRDQIHEILALPNIAEAWQTLRGATPTDEEIEELYFDYLPKQTDLIGGFPRLVPGIPEMAEGLRSRSVMIGSTTGYTREMADFLVDYARQQGFELDCVVCPEHVPGGGRPLPWMCYLNAIRLEISPLWTMVKIGDTPTDIEEGLNAGMWTVGITRTGNEVGLSEEDWEEVPEEDRAALIEVAEARLTEAGAHYLLESAADCLDIIDDISARIAAGERP